MITYSKQLQIPRKPGITYIMGDVAFPLRFSLGAVINLFHSTERTPSRDKEGNKATLPFSDLGKVLERIHSFFCIVGF